VKFIEGAKEGFIRWEGSADMALEMVSASSAQKDTVDLRIAYWEAGITEYWLVDAREEEIRFDILKHGPRGYTATRRQAGGWLRSAVFGRSFMLTQTNYATGQPRVVLTVRE